MKAKLLLVSAMVVIAAAAMFVSCNGNTPTNGCVCTFTWEGETETERISLETMKNHGWSTCSQVAAAFKEEGENASCKAY